MLPAHFLDQFGIELAWAVFQTNQEYRMSAQNITGLADVIRQAKSALAGVPAVADAMKSTTASVLSKVQQVQALVGELKSAEAELAGVLEQGANGGPPLETTTVSAPAIPTPSPIDQQPTVNAIHDDTGAVERPKLSV